MIESGKKWGAGVWGMAVGAAAAVCVAPAAGAAVQYRVELLETLTPGQGWGWARAVNDSGVVAGDAVRVTGPSTTRFPAVRWEAGATGPTELADFGMGNSLGFGINDAGDVVGHVAGQAPRPVLWRAGGTAVTELGPRAAFPRAINNGGIVVGYAETTKSGEDGPRAVRWSGGTSAVELGHLGLGPGEQTNAYAYSVNDAGVAVGEAQVYQGNSYRGTRGVRWDAGGTAAVELPLLNLTYPGRVEAVAKSINAVGTIVGTQTMFSGTSPIGTRAVLWPVGGGAAVELPHLGLDLNGQPAASAVGINDAGDVVGKVSKYVDGVYVEGGVAMWAAGGTGPVFLKDLIEPGSGWVLSEVTGIADGGWIVGNGFYDPDGAGPVAQRQASFRLVPVPEPGVGLVVAMGVGVVMGRRVRCAHGTRDGASVS